MKRSDFLKAFAALPFMRRATPAAFRTAEEAEDEAPAQYDKGPTQTMTWSVQEDPDTWTTGTVWLYDSENRTYTSGTTGT